MILGSLTEAALLERAEGAGLRFKTGTFTITLRTDIPEFLDTFISFYAAAALAPSDEPSHFEVSVIRARGLRRWARRQARFSVDGLQPFEPYPLSHAFPMYEWGLNWCIGTTAHHNLMLHSAVVEKEGRGVILPAIPGSGKSTLCAGLVSRGWRLLSDEFGVVRHYDGKVLPLPRAAPLKNESIDLIRDFAPHLALGPRYEQTRKGTVVHMQPPTGSLQRQDEPVSPRWIIFPRYGAGLATRLTPQPPALALTRLSNNSFNYPVAREAGFRTLTRMIRGVECFELLNGDLGEAVAVIEGLLERDLE
jgi:HprK-related kinase A